MTQKKYNHTHKFRRDRYSTGRAFYYCTMPDCQFKIDVHHSIGKHCLCNKCGTIFTMNEYSIRAAKPVCMNCIQRRTVPVQVPSLEIDNILGDLDANLVDRHDKPARNTAEISTNSITSLEERLHSLSRTTIKEYNPEDEDDSL